ncbi:Ribonuclease HI [Buchnera aphidicola (Eriosoma grossulariae)]|uniref:ribonuclease HI n=1 Tax=Buchnera aphidicola TaxID=9 RepID=UPI00346445D3
MLKSITIFTDGSCLGNPGPGGYGILMRYKKHEKIFQNGFYWTTNNRMELMSVIIGIEKIKEMCQIKIITDSQYVQKGVSIWLKNWKKKNWRNNNNKLIKNLDLWTKLNTIMKIHKIQWIWINSHSGYIENEKCDLLAKMSAKNPSLIDFGYIDNINNSSSN